MLLSEPLDAQMSSYDGAATWDEQARALLADPTFWLVAWLAVLVVSAAVVFVVRRRSLIETAVLVRSGLRDSHLVGFGMLCLGISGIGAVTAFLALIVVLMLVVFNMLRLFGRFSAVVFGTAAFSLTTWGAGAYVLGRIAQPFIF